jgi:uncharacterized membrane protein
MLAAEIWHWWIGVVLLIVSILAVAGLVGSYLKSVSSRRYPPDQARQAATKSDL